MAGTKWMRGKKNSGPRATARRGRALERLEDQLLKGEKSMILHVELQGVGGNDAILSVGALSVSDIKRIKREMETLRTRI